MDQKERLRDLALSDLHQLVLERDKLEIFYFGRHIADEVEVKLPSSLSLHEVEFIPVAKENKDVVEIVVMHADDESILMLGVVSWESEPIAILDAVVVVLELIDQLSSSQQGNELALVAEATADERSEPFEGYRIDGIEVVLAVISDLVDPVLTDHDEGSKMVVVETV